MNIYMLTMKRICYLMLTVGLLACFNSVSACSKIDKDNPTTSRTIALDSDSVYRAKIFPKSRRQMITTWGHDIKQEGRAANLTVSACRQIFQDGRFNILRIPFYSAAHNL